MAKQREVSRLGWILLPFLAALAIGIFPRPLLEVNNLKTARVALIEHRPGLVSDALTRFLAFFPERGDLWEMAGTNALSAGRTTDAINDLRKAQALGQLGMSGTIALGDAYLAAGEPANAVTVWSGALQQFGPTEQGYQRLVRTYLDQGNYPQALTTLKSWSAWQPDNPKVLYQLGLLLATSFPKEALPPLLKAEQLDSGLSPSVKLLQARINSASGITDPSVTLLQAGRGLGELNEWKLAAEAFNQAIALSPNYAEAWAFEAEARRQLGLESQSYLDKAMALNSRSILVLALQAITLESRGKSDEALVYLHTIADQEPQNGIWQAEIGNALSQMGDLKNALSYYQNAVQIEPGNPMLWRALANYCLIYSNQVDTIGLPAAREAVALAPDDSTGLDLLGQALVKMGDYSSASRFYNRAVDNNPDYAMAYLHLGMMYLDQGSMDQAYQSLNKVIQLASDQPEGQQAQRLIDRFFPH